MNIFTRVDESIGEQPGYEDEVFYEKEGFRITSIINTKPPYIPYFKVYDNSSYTSATKVARLHFKNYGIEDHKDRYESWYPNNKEIKMIRNFMMNQHVDFPQYTNWQMACWLWNLEYDFFNNHNRDEYFAGKFDEEYKDHPSYVPSTQKMPETWIYDPLKSKK